MARNTNIETGVELVARNTETEIERWVGIRRELVQQLDPHYLIDGRYERAPRYGGPRSGGGLHEKIACADAEIRRLQMEMFCEARAEEERAKEIRRQYAEVERQYQAATDDIRRRMNMGQENY